MIPFSVNLRSESEEITLKTMQVPITPGRFS